MFENTTKVVDTKTYVCTLPSAMDSLKLLSASTKSLRSVLGEIIIDSDKNPNAVLGEYYKNSLHYKIKAMPVRNYVLLDCANWLQTNAFENFSIKRIFIRYEEKELIVVSNIVNDDVLEEFYNKTFEFAYRNDNEIVFMITTEDAICYPAMPKYDKIIEVEDHE